MSANAAVAETAEAAAASEVLDLNADAAAVDSQEQARATAADATKPLPAEALVEVYVRSQGTEAEGLNGEGSGPAEDGKGEVVAEAEDAGATVRQAAVEGSGGGEGLQGMTDSGRVAEGEGDGSVQSAETKVYESTRTEIVVEATEVAVEDDEGADKEENLPLKTENKRTEGCTEPNGGKSSPVAGHVVQECSGMDRDDCPLGSVDEADVEKVHVHSEPTIGEDHSGDVAASDLNSSVVIGQSVESENTCSQTVVEKLKDQGDAVVADVNLVTVASSGETEGEKTLVGEPVQEEGHAVIGDSTPAAENTLVGETVQEEGLAVMGDSAPAAENTLLPASQASEDQSHQCPTQVDAPTTLPDVRVQEIGEKHDDTYAGEEKPAGEGDDVVINTDLDDNLPSVDQTVVVVASTKGDSDTSQVAVSDSFLPSEHEKVNIHSEDTLVTGDKWIDTDRVIMPDSILVGDSSQPKLVVGEDVSPDLVTEYESIVTDTVPSEEMHAEEVKLNKKEDDRVFLPSDTAEDEVAREDTDGDEKESNMPEPTDKEEQFVKCPLIEPGAAGTEENERASYELPQEDKTAFSISDLVWGKVKSHPWWPGLICNPSDASDMALKHQKRENFLVAYFGDKTFAWCDESKLKPFLACFSQLAYQSTSDTFINAVNSALVEVSRHVELGMSCICVPEEIISNLKHRKIENAGIREGSSCSVLDKSFGVTTFEPNNFLDYIKALALYPCGGMNKLELVIAKSQLMAFNCLRGHIELSALHGGEGSLKNDAVTSPSKRKRYRKSIGEHPSTSTKDEVVASDSSVGKQKKKALEHRQKHIPEHGRKQKSLSELMDDKKHSDLVNGDGIATEMDAPGQSLRHSSGKKRKKDDSSSYSGKSKRKRLDDLGDLEKKTPFSDRSFKVGECISRVASKLTGSPSIIKCNGESLKKGSAGKADQGSPQVFDVSSHIPEDTRRTRKGIMKNYSSPEEMLSQLCLAARDPMKGYSFLSAVICFFTEVRGLRDSGPVVDKHFERIKKKRGRKKKSESTDDSKIKLSGEHMPDHLNQLSVKIGRKRGRKKKSESSNVLKTDTAEASTPDYMTDSYWTDRIVCTTPEEKSQSGRRKRKAESLNQSKTKKTKPSQEPFPISKMLEAAHHLRISALSPTANRDSALEKQAIFSGEKCLEESTPTALILSFNEADALPSETNLIRTFSRYGPLKEAETEVLNETSCAKVVFKRRADAEVAFSSAGKYRIFGPALVSFRLRYLPSTPMASPEARSDGRKDGETSNGVCLGTPEVVKELAQDAGMGLTREELKESAESVVKDLTQDEMKELSQEEVKELGQEEAKDPTQEEAKELAQEEAKELSQEEAEELGQNESKESTQKGVKALAQEKVKDLDQDGMKEVTQEEAKELALNKVKEVTQEEVKELAQAEVQE